MDPKVARRLERELEKAITEVVRRLRLKELPLLPAHQTMKDMAKAAVAVYETAVGGPEDSTAGNRGKE